MNYYCASDAEEYNILTLGSVTTRIYTMLYRIPPMADQLRPYVQTINPRTFPSNDVLLTLGVVGEFRAITFDGIGEMGDSL